MLALKYNHSNFHSGLDRLRVLPDDCTSAKLMKAGTRSMKKYVAKHMGEGAEVVTWS